MLSPATTAAVCFAVARHKPFLLLLSKACTHGVIEGHGGREVRAAREGEGTRRAPWLLITRIHVSMPMFMLGRLGEEMLLPEIEREEMRIGD